MTYVAKGYCHCGCGGKTPLARQTIRSRGYVKGEPVDYIPHHHLRKSQFRHEIEEETGCWIWRGCLNPDGYGQIRDRDTGKTIKAHRFYYERFIGVVSEGLELDHLCRNPACVNPEHLEPVTHAENMRRGTICQLNAEAVNEIRTSDESNAALGRKFGVTRQAVRAVRIGKTWVAS